MGASCCSNVKEPKEITITKPEKNILISNTNDNNEQNTNNLKIIDLEQNSKNQNQTYNTVNQQIDINSYQNTSTPLTQKELDDILNQALQNVDDLQDIMVNPNNINSYQNENTDMNNLISNQDQNAQNIPIEQEIQKNISSQLNTQNQVNQEYNDDLNIEEIIKKQSNQSKTDLDIEEIVKNTELNQNNQADNNFNDLNFDIFFNNSGNEQITDELIDKIFESTEKRNNNPLYLSQQIQPTKMKGNMNVNNQYYSPSNSVQRSGVMGPISSQLKQIYEIK